MTFWSDDRNHLLDDTIAFLWFGLIALAIGVPPLQFPLLVLVLRFIEKPVARQCANFVWGSRRVRTRSFAAIPSRSSWRVGVWTTKLQLRCRAAVVGHAVSALRIFQARFRRDLHGDPSGDEAAATGSWLAQQRSGLRRLWSALGFTAQ